jgi:hypothetical protein
VCERERERKRERYREREISPSSTILMSRIVEHFVNNELGGIWKEAIEVFRYYPVTYLRKTKKNFSSG